MPKALCLPMPSATSGAPLMLLGGSNFQNPHRSDVSLAWKVKAVPKEAEKKKEEQAKGRLMAVRGNGSCGKVAKAKAKVGISARKRLAAKEKQQQFIQDIA